MKKPKVAILDNSIDVTGALNAILGYAEFAQTEFEFLFILPTESKASIRVKEKGFDVIELSFIEISRNWKSLLLYFPQLVINGIKLKEIARRENIDIIHVNDFYNLTGVVAKALGGSFKILTHVRFIPNRFPSILVYAWVRLNLKFSDTIICVSQAVKAGLEDHPKIKVIYDGLPKFSYQRPRLDEEKEYFNLLYLGHYIRGKGQNLALEAFAQAFRQNSQMRLRFVGGDMGLEKNRRYKEELTKRAAELGVLEVVTFSGPTLNIEKEILAADIMLNFSESESFSMTCLEALTCGVPLIATDCGGPVELFEHKETGLLVANKDISAMCDAILQLLENPNLRKKFSEKSAKYVEVKFAVANTYLVLLNQYQLMLFSSKNEM